MEELLEVNYLYHASNKWSLLKYFQGRVTITQGSSEKAWIFVKLKVQLHI